MGRAKAWLPFGELVFLQHVVAVLRAVVEPVVVVAAPGQVLPSLPDGVIVVHDPVEARGPLQGLATGLAALRDRVDAVYVSACDVPFLRAEFVRHMIACLTPDVAIAIPHIGDYHHPLAAVYRVSVLDAVNALLEANRMRPVFLFETVPTRIVTEAELIACDPTLQSVRNVNTPEEYERALRDFAGHPYNPI